MLLPTHPHPPPIARIPSDYFALDPTWKNLFENPSATQFDHRLLGTSTGVTVLALWAYTRRLPLHPRAMMAVNAMVGMVGVQISLGIATLLYFVPTSLAAAHQCEYIRFAVSVAACRSLGAKLSRA